MEGKGGREGGRDLREKAGMLGTFLILIQVVIMKIIYRQIFTNVKMYQVIY